MASQSTIRVHIHPGVFLRASMREASNAHRHLHTHTLSKAAHEHLIDLGKVGLAEWQGGQYGNVG
eukprot:1159033-Pelagomonas_calceolata.AAC.8